MRETAFSSKHGMLFYMRTDQEQTINLTNRHWLSQLFVFAQTIDSRSNSAYSQISNDVNLGLGCSILNSANRLNNTLRQRSLCNIPHILLELLNLTRAQNNPILLIQLRMIR